MDDLQADVDAVARIQAVPTILDIVCRTTGMGFAGVARVTEDRWIACSVKDDIAFGLQPGDELRVETTICHEIRQHRAPVIINCVADDPAFARHATPCLYGFQSYISVPILLPDSSFFGTLCAIDPKPHRLDTPEVVGMFKLFAELIAFHLDADARLASSAAALSRERETALLREQFIAVLGHDLRNPLTAISAGASMLLRQPERAVEFVGHIRRSITRMAGMIDNVLDFARGRMGGGLTLNRDVGAPIEPSLRQILQELLSARPDRIVEADFMLEEPVTCDRGRIAQVFSNLLGNADRYGAPDQPIRVRATARGGMFELSVANGGEQIPADALPNLFQPFFRGAGHQGREGLGLGLYIASEIARGHGGVLEAASTPAETRFTLRMPTR